MRNTCGLALLILTTVALSGCVNSTFDSLSSLQNGCSTSPTSVSCSSPTPVVTPPTTPPTSPSGAPIVNTGNNSGITSGDTTIALESSVNTTPVGTPAISKLNSDPLKNTIALGTATANQQIWFNTNTATNGLWPVSKTMNYNEYDTCLNNGGSFTGHGAVAATGTHPAYAAVAATQGTCTGTPILDSGGNKILDANGNVLYNLGVGGTALGGNYKAYRFYQPGTYDEELQIWSWNNSYATQYRDVTASATAPQHQAWSFGGNYTTAAAMPIAGSVNYAGKWTSTATTAGFTANTGSTTVPLLDAAGNPVIVNGTPQTTSIAQTVVPSNTWSVNGNSALTANFATNTLTGTLTSTSWQGVNNLNGLSTVDPIAAQNYYNACAVGNAAICNTTTLAGQADLQYVYNWAPSYMDSHVVLNGNITTSTTNAAKPNQVVGTAVMDPNNGWITDTTSNPMFAGFFGPVAGGKPQEVTGNFALRATITNPNGGIAINNDRRATIEMSGIFNGQ